jgi:hypothetical protein
VTTTMRLDGERFLSGLEWAVEQTDGPIFCIMQGGTYKLVFMGGLRLAISWVTPRSPNDEGEGFFLIPQAVAPDILRLPRMPLDVSVDHDEVKLGAGGSALLSRAWSFDPRELAAPPQFSQMIVPPSELMKVEFIPLSDVVHRAVAKLGEKDVSDTVHRSKLAILVHMQQSSLLVDGVEISRGLPERFYFDPRLIVRSLEYLTGETLGMGLHRLGFGNRAIIYLVSKAEDHSVCCGLLSISLDTQKLYPLPPVQRPMIPA